MKMKQIKLETKEARKLIELMDRGLAYTDSYYRDYKSQNKIFNTVMRQLKEQGMFKDYIIYD
jgi:hypothetical protein